MANANEAFPSNFLKAENFDAGAQTLTIKDVQIKFEFNDGSHKPCVTFTDERKLICNVTNWNLLKELYGTDTDHWIGKPLTLYKTKVDYQGKRVDAIRINPATAPAAATNGNRAGTPQNAHEAALEDARSWMNTPVPITPAAMKTWIAKAKMGNGHTPTVEDLTIKADELAGACYGAGVPDKVVEAIFATEDVPAKLAAMWDAVNSLIGRNQGDVNI